MRHIDEFTISRFRGIRDLKLEGLGQINLLVGENNSGKTSVLEALFLFCDPLNQRRWLEIATMRDIVNGSLRPSLINQLTWLFPQVEYTKNGGTSEEADIALSAGGTFSQEKVSAHYEKFTEINAGNPDSALGESKGIRIGVVKSCTGKSVSETFVFYDDRTFSIKEDTDPLLPTQIINSSSHRLTGLTPALWSDVVLTRLKKETTAFLSLFDTNIEEIDIVAPTVGQQPFVSIDHKKVGHAPLSTFGDGLRHAFTLVTAVPGVKDGLLLVDDLETAIHTRMLRKTFNWLIQACVQNNVQFFATTHSLESIDVIIDACSEQPIDLVAYRLEQYKGQLDVTRLDKGLLTRLRENLAMEVR